MWKEICFLKFFLKKILQQNCSEMTCEEWEIKVIYTGVGGRREFKRALLCCEGVSKFHALKECTEDFQNSSIVLTSFLKNFLQDITKRLYLLSSWDWVWSYNTWITHFGQVERWDLLKGLAIKEIQIDPGNNQMKKKNLSSKSFP